MQPSTCSEGASVTNNAGTLKCKESLPPNADNVPDGSYTGSCHGCTVSDDALSCSCFNGAGDAFPTTLALPCAGTIGNAEGQLRCEEPERRLDEAGGTGYTPEAETEAVAVEATGEQAPAERDEL